MSNDSTIGQERTYARGRATKAHLLDVARDHFAEFGYRGSSLRDIAQRAGMSHPGLLYHFPTKEALLMAVLERRDQVDGEVNPVRGEDGLVALRNLVASAYRNEANRGVVELFAVVSAEATSAEHPAHEFFVARYQRLVAAVTTAFERVRDAGQLHEGIDPGVAAVQTVALMDGLQIQWLLGSTPISMGDAMRAHFAALVDAEL
ncbi:MAG: TetR/AcrR family transcriptional regulator [Demequina sp.]|uniref:TetR/AcrR family transcriptional regulator n=1 Tax=Demequina sp. TaxID=2050685 RepID=UPI003A88F537